MSEVDEKRVDTTVTHALAEIRSKQYFMSTFTPDTGSGGGDHAE